MPSASVHAITPHLWFESSASQVLFLAHRGASHQAPENGRSAFHKANDEFRRAELALGRPVFQGYEFDVQPSGCDAFGKRQVVVFHDDAGDGGLRRTTRDPQGILRRLGYQSDRPVSETPWDVLRLLSSGTWKTWQGKRFPNERILLLSEILNIALPQTFLDCEVKRNTITLESDGFEQLLLDTLEEIGFRHRGLVHSFDCGFIERFRQLTEQRGLREYYPVGLAFWAQDRDRRNEWLPRIQPEVLVLQHHKRMKEDIDQSHAVGRKVLVWTVNSRSLLRRCLAAGADGIIGNRPELLYQNGAISGMLRA